MDQSDKIPTSYKCYLLPALELVPVVGASQKALQKYICPSSLRYTYAVDDSEKKTIISAKANIP
jgi:hypothetical protein